MIYFSGGQNQPQPAPTMNQGPMTPMMPNTNMQQSGQMMVSDPNGSYSQLTLFILDSSISSKQFFLEVQ
jgi:hypothetical protein